MTDIGDYRMPYGKFKGKILSDIPSSYLKWFLDNVKQEDTLYIEIDKEYQFREKYNNHWNEDD